MVLTEQLKVLLLYGGLAGAYLLVIPMLSALYIDQRWTSSSSWEKVLMFFLALFFFPGILLISPFWNFRFPKREI